VRASVAAHTAEAAARRPAFAIALLAAAIVRAACQAQGVADGQWGDRYRAGDDSEAALPSLKQVMLESFDAATEAAWQPSMPLSDVVAETRIAPASTAGPGGALGVKVQFMRRAASALDLRPRTPIRIDGRCVGLSLRVYGAGIPHELRLLVLDYYGTERELSLGRLDFRGWRRLEAAIPGLGAGSGAYVQDDRHYRDPAGLRVSGLRLVFDLEESYGQYVAYFDELGALVDSEVPAPGPADAAEAAAPPGVAGPDAAGPRVSEEAAAPASAVAEARALALEEIRLSIASRMKYPEAARLRGIEGTMLLAFRIGAEGALASARVAKGSGSELLDRAGLELLRGAFPVKNASGLVLDLEIPITFRLDDAPRD
jgi:TonB family protein